MPEEEVRHHLRHLLMYLEAAREHAEVALRELEQHDDPDVRAALHELEGHILESSRPDPADAEKGK
jgi:hypothetical protein